MEKYIAVMKQSTELLETTYEGLQHVQALIKEGKYEATLPLFSDVVQAFTTLEKTIVNLPDEILSVDLNNATTQVRNGLDLVVGSYELNKYGKIQEILQFILIPGYRRWMEGLQQAFKSYLVS